jgi:SAM-dependent methyltransferase
VWRRLARLEDFLLLPAIKLKRKAREEPFHIRCFGCGKVILSSEETWNGYCNRCVVSLGEFLHARKLYELKWSRHSLNKDSSLNALLKFILKKVGGGNILDVGCGRGDFLNNLESIRDKYRVGVDIALSAISSQRKFDFVLCDTNWLPLRDGIFDWIVCTELLEHINDPVRVVDECHRVAKKNGAVVFTVPNGKGVFGDIPYHVHTYRLLEFVNMIRMFFQIREIFTWGLWLPILNSLLNKDVLGIKIPEVICTHFIITSKKTA